jgi:hypothetical protein
MLQLHARFSEDGYRIWGTKHHNGGNGVDIKYDYRSEAFYDLAKDDASIMSEMHWVIFNDMMDKLIETILPSKQPNVFVDIYSSSSIIQLLDNMGFARAQADLSDFARCSIEYHLIECKDHGLITRYHLTSKEECKRLLDLDGVMGNGPSENRD